MATVTLLGSIWNTTSGTKTVTAAPAAGSLIVIVTAHTGNTSTATPTDNNSGGAGAYSTINNAKKATNADTMMMHIRTAVVGTAASTVFTHAPGSSTGGGLAVYQVTGLGGTGLSAVVKSAIQQNQAASTTPAPVMASAVSTTNPVIGAVFNATNPATITPRTAYTEDVDTGYSTPTAGLQTIRRISGETATTLTWGGTSGSAFASMAVELLNNTPPTTALNTPTDSATGLSSTPTLNFTGTDPNGDAVEYQVQVYSEAKIADYPISNNDGDPDCRMYSTGDTGNSQSFTSTGGTLSKARFAAALHFGTASGTLVAKLYAITGTMGTDSAPTGSALATSATVNANVITSGTYVWLDFEFTDGFVMVNGTNYAIAIELVSGMDSGEIKLAFDYSSTTHAGNRAYYYPGFGGWNGVSNYDLVFEVYAESLVLDKVSTTDAGFTAGHPYTSGVAKEYTVQAADELAASATYSWRARAIDPTGSNTYGPWTATRSFTVTSAGDNAAPTGISSTASLGFPTVSPGAVSRTPSGHTNTSTIGTPTLTSVVTLTPTAIASTATLGVPTLAPGAVNIAPTGKTSSQTIGSPSLTAGAVTLSPTGLTSGAIGSPTLSSSATLTPTGLSSTATIGAPTVTPGSVAVSPAGITSSPALGSPSLSPGTVSVSPSGIASTPAIGAPSLNSSVSLPASGIASAANLGSPTLTSSSTIAPSGLASTLAIGAPTVAAAGTNVIMASGLDSPAAIGSPSLTPGEVSASTTGVSSSTAIGTPTLSAGGASIAPAGIPGESVIGALNLTPGTVSLIPAGVDSSMVFGSPVLSNRATGQPAIPEVFLVDLAQPTTAADLLFTSYEVDLRPSPGLAVALNTSSSSIDLEANILSADLKANTITIDL